VGDLRGEASTLYNIGKVYSEGGEKQKALEYYNQSLTLERAVGDRRGEALTLIGIGNVYSRLGEKQKALEYYNQSLPLRTDTWRSSAGEAAHPQQHRQSLLRRGRTAESARVLQPVPPAGTGSRRSRWGSSHSQQHCLYQT
jgi:tetratricopeptide (TPR) repeat protein